MLQSTNDFIKTLEGKSREELIQIRYDLMQYQKQLLEERERLNIFNSLAQHNLEAINLKLHDDSVSKTDVWKRTLYITDHALIRYLERIEKRDIDKLRKHIMDSLPDTILSGCPSIKSGQAVYKISYVERNRTLITTVIRKA